MVSTNALVTAPVVAMQMPSEPPGTYAGAIGSRYVWFVLASIVIDAFAGGYLTITKDTGVGYCYRIKRNTASATLNGTASTIILELYEPLQVALDHSSDISVTGSLFNDLVATLNSTDHIISGVTCAAMTGATTAAPKFGWICTHGMCACLQDGTVANGDLIQQSSAVAGAFSTFGVGTTSNYLADLFLTPKIGFAVDQSADTQHGTIFLQLE
jgi:hypothetical protein